MTAQSENIIFTKENPQIAGEHMERCWTWKDVGKREL